MATPACLDPGIDASSDEGLMLSYAAGDAAAFDALYARHRGGVYRYMLRHCRHAAAADELFQDVWMNVIRSRDTYTPSARFATWLYRIAHNRVIDHWRTQGNSVVDAVDDEVLDSLPDARAVEPDARAHAGEVRERLAAALRDLPPLQRDAFLLHEEGGLSLAEIAELTRAPVETVKSRLRYASARLRAALGDLR